MAKSIWKLPSLNYSIEQLFLKQPDNRKIDKMTICKRALVISPLAMEKKVQIHNGLKYISLHIQSEHIGYKYGAFALTRKRFIPKKKKRTK